MTDRCGRYLGSALGIAITSGLLAWTIDAGYAGQTVNETQSGGRVKFDPQAIYDLLGLKPLEFPETDSPAQRTEPHGTNAAVAIVNFQVRGRDQAASQIQDDRRQEQVAEESAQRDLVRIAVEDDAVEDLLIPEHTATGDGLVEDAATGDRHVLDGQERLDGLADELADDGSFDLTVTATQTTAEDPSYNSPPVTGDESFGWDPPAGDLPSDRDSFHAGAGSAAVAPVESAPDSTPNATVDEPVTPIGSDVIAGPPPVAGRTVSFQAEKLIGQGIQLARRGAIYSSRAQFVRALRLITQAYDTQRGTRQYSDSLARGFRALEEADDFRPRGSRLEADLDLKRIVQSHRTPILHDADLRRMSALDAQRAYHVYAENQLVRAGGKEAKAADALFALGKLQKHLSLKKGNADSSRDATSMSLYQAALMIHPDHQYAANELGVLFARYGQWQDARAVLRHCVRDRTSFPEVWRNLARVHAELGEPRLARLALNEWRAGQAAGTASRAGLPEVEWVDPQTFAATSRPEDVTAPPPELAGAGNHAPARKSRKARAGADLPSLQGQPLSLGQRYSR